MGSEPTFLAFVFHKKRLLDKKPDEANEQSFASYACITRIRLTVGLGTTPLSRLPPAPVRNKFRLLVRPVNRR